jgi:hypothetical protein
LRYASTEKSTLVVGVVVLVAPKLGDIGTILVLVSGGTVTISSSRSTVAVIRFVAVPRVRTCKAPPDDWAIKATRCKFPTELLKLKGKLFVVVGSDNCLIIVMKLPLFAFNSATSSLVSSILYTVSLKGEDVLAYCISIVVFVVTIASEDVAVSPTYIKTDISEAVVAEKSGAHTDVLSCTFSDIELAFPYKIVDASVSSYKVDACAREAKAPTRSPMARIENIV